MPEHASWITVDANTVSMAHARNMSMASIIGACTMIMIHAYSLTRMRAYNMIIVKGMYHRGACMHYDRSKCLSERGIRVL